MGVFSYLPTRRLVGWADVEGFGSVPSSRFDLTFGPEGCWLSLRARANAIDKLQII